MTNYNIRALDIQASFTSPATFGNIDFQGYSADSIVEWTDVDFTENRIGADGIMASGLIASIGSVSFMFEGASPSYSALQNGLAICQASKTNPIGTLIVTYPSQRYRVIVASASLKNMTPFLSADKVIKSVKVTFEFSATNDGIRSPF